MAKRNSRGRGSHAAFGALTLLAVAGTGAAAAQTDRPAAGAQAAQSAESTPAAGPEAPADRTDAQVLDRIVVTARAGAGERRRADTSYAITAIEEEQLRMDAPIGLADALKAVPGFWVESSGGEASANIRVRGIPQEGFSSLGLLEDGLPLQHDPGLGFLNGDQAFRIDETLQRVEVVRGGPASIFTSNAPGGVVNLITRRGTDVPEGLVKLDTADYSRLRADAWWGGPVGDSAWRIGIGGFFRRDDGVRDPGFTANSGGQLRMNLTREFDGGLVDFDVKRIDDNVVFYTGLPLTRDTNGDVVGVPGINANTGILLGPETRSVILRNAAGAFPLDIDRGTDVVATQFTARLGWTLGDWNLDQRLRFRTSDSARIGLFPGTPVRAADRLAALRPQVAAAFPIPIDLQLRYVNAPNEPFDLLRQNGNGLVVDGALREVSVPLDEWIGDFRLQRSFDLGGQRHDVAFGVYFASVEKTFTRYSANALLDVRDNARLLDIVVVDAAGRPLTTLTENGITRYGSEFANGIGESMTWALYASDEWQITDRLRLDLGARWETVAMEGQAERFAGRNLGGPTFADDNVLTGTGQFDRFDTDYEDLGYSLGVDWRIDDNSGLFGRYTYAFRLPNVGNFVTSPGARPITQEMNFLEAGYKFATPELQLFATAFLTRFDTFTFTELVFDPATGSFNQRIETTDTRTPGLELEGSWSPTPWFDVTAAATWQEPEFGEFRFTQLVSGAPVRRDFSGNQLIRTPRVSARLIPALNLFEQRLRLELDIEHYGQRFSDAANEVELPAYTVLGLNARYDFHAQGSLYLNAENLRNEVGLTEGNPRAGQFVSGEAGSPFFVGRPIVGRNFRLALLWRF